MNTARTFATLTSAVFAASAVFGASPGRTHKHNPTVHRSGAATGSGGTKRSIPPPPISKNSQTHKRVPRATNPISATGGQTHKRAPRATDPPPPSGGQTHKRVPRSTPPPPIGNQPAARQSVPKTIPPISVDGRTKQLAARGAATTLESRPQKSDSQRTGTPRIDRRSGLPERFASVEDLRTWAEALRYRDAAGAPIQHPWRVRIENSGGDKKLYILTVYAYGTMDQGDVAIWESSPTGMFLQAWQNDVDLSTSRESTTVHRGSGAPMQLTNGG